MIRLTDAPKPATCFNKLINGDWYRVRMVARPWPPEPGSNERIRSPQIGEEFYVLAVQNNPLARACFNGYSQFVWACCTANPACPSGFSSFPRVKILEHVGEKPANLGEDL